MKRGRGRLALSLAFAVVGTAPAAQAAMPEGSLDAASWNLVGGWARDPDNATPIAVHIYIDGNLAHAMLADGLRPDLPYADQNHGFTWVPPLLGPGNHQVVVHAIGVDANGALDAENPSLSGTPKTISAGCTGFDLSALAWCQGVSDSSDGCGCRVGPSLSGSLEAWLLIIAGLLAARLRARDTTTLPPHAVAPFCRCQRSDASIQAQRRIREARVLRSHRNV